MIDLPTSTVVNRFVPKEKFYSKTSMNTKLRQQFTDEIEKITWTHKISSDTLNITSKDNPELQVFEVVLKSTDISSMVLRHIDTHIPYPILFLIKKPGAIKAVLSFKEVSAESHARMKVDSYFDSGWQKDLTLELKGRSVGEIYKNYLYQLAPELRNTKQTNTKESVEINKTKKAIQKQIDKINIQIRNELSLPKKQELARLRYEREQQRNEL